jgi:hypothetical protein
MFLACFILVGNRQIGACGPRSSRQGQGSKKYLQIITGVTKALPAFILGTVETQDLEKERLKKNQEFKFGNNVSYSELLSSLFDNISFCIADEAKTEEQPDGDSFMT